MKKIILLFFILLVLITPNSLAFFTQNHIFWILRGFEDTSSPITQMCRDKIDIVLDGQHSTDVPVIHYMDEKVTSYISTHTKGSGNIACREVAGTDETLRCFCVGNALHIVQDSFAHTTNGLVPKYLSKFFGSNLFNHMIIERSYEKKSREYWEENNVELIADGRLDYYDSIVLNNLFEEFGGDPEYLELLNDMSGIDMKNDAKIFRSGYLGEGFYSTVYKDKVKLPFQAYAISIGLMIISLPIMIFMFIFGRTWWKYLIILEFIIIFGVGLILFISFVTGTTWQIVNVIIEIPPIVGMFDVNDKDLQEYNRLVQEATNNYLRTGILPYDDASGLSYVDSKGNYVEGALSKAEKPFKFVLFPIFVIIFLLINLYLFYKTFREK